MPPNHYAPKYPTLTSAEFALWTVMRPKPDIPGESAVQAAIVNPVVCEPRPKRYRDGLTAYQREWSVVASADRQVCPIETASSTSSSLLGSRLVCSDASRLRHDVEQGEQQEK